MEGVDTNNKTTCFLCVFDRAAPNITVFTIVNFKQYQTALIRNICFDCENINNLTLHLEPNNQISDSIAQKQ